MFLLFHFAFCDILCNSYYLFSYLDVLIWVKGHIYNYCLFFNILGNQFDVDNDNFDRNE